ncbi:hypothetical protein FE415_07480 [Leuconostoc carnosum]|uniref:hypothetical protein n=1 Tax=Leuconostoc carnosum TaxID=1252 RepID=UPI0012384546|nr:hypothetical protein [Leuconostoc carnosum]KAA8371910.1 hypothetical protein FE415_07480 [Leuconostoc carnosum]
MAYLLDDDKPIVFSTNEMFLSDCQDALTNKGYELSRSEKLKHKKKLPYNINQHGTETVLGSVSLPSVAKTIIEYVEKEHFVALEYEFIK